LVLHHLGVRASDFEASKSFYASALRPLGVVAFYEAEDVAEFGREDGEGPSLSLHRGEPTRRMHLAFKAQDREPVHAFYEAAVRSGGRDNGPPERARSTRAYCAFVLDPDGNNVEALVKERA
jgi:catechol 2,3-dioxygenase-like lactoylglutathione lyase family enzyme